MAQKKFNQNFAADFTGIDGESTPLEPDSNGVNRAVNLEQAVGNSLRGRVGCQVAGSPGGFFAIFPYSYTRTQDEYAIKYQTAAGVYPNQTANLTTTKTTADGSTVTSLIAINQQSWVLDNLVIPLTLTGCTYPVKYYTTVSGSNINLVIKDGSTTLLDTSLSNGVTGSVKIWDLLNTINGIGAGKVTVSRTTRGTCPPFAIVDVNQNSVAAGASPFWGGAFTISVNNTPHNLKAGDIISFPTTANTYLNGLVNNLASGVVIATTATQITYVGNVIYGLLAGDVLGYMGQAATSIPISTATSVSSGGTINLTIPYWRSMPDGGGMQSQHFYDSAVNWIGRSSSSYYSPPSYVNANGNLYIATSAPTALSQTSGLLAKVDGKSLTSAGVNTPSPLLTDAGAGVLTGVYKYKIYFKRIDAQGNITEGRPALSTITLAGGRYVQVQAYLPTVYNNDGRMDRAGYKHTQENTAAAGVPQFFYVDDRTGGVGLANYLQPGDPVCFLDNTQRLAGGGGANTGVWRDVLGGVASGNLIRSFCTDYCDKAATISPTTTSIKIASTTTYTIPADSEISAGMTVVFTRTTAGGNVYYQLAEVPVVSSASYVSILDNVNDSILVGQSQFFDAQLGKEHDPPPKCSLVCSHQGGLVTARGFGAPNTVNFSTADGIEYFPLASNSLDVPSSQAGAITAIASDTADRLAVFKEKSYYDIQGDLDGGSFSVNVINEGDYGITSQASLVRVHNALIGLSKLGYVTVQDGSLNPFKFKDLNTRLINQNYNFNWAVAVNDYFNRNYTCCIPTGSGFVTHVIDYSRIAVKTFERSYPSQIDQAGGMAMVGDTLYHLSATSPYAVFRRLYRFNGDSPTGNNGDSFIDNTSAISYIFETNPISNDEPDVLNTPIRLRLWSLPNDYVIEGWVPFSVLVEGGSSPLAAYVGSAYPGGTSSTLTFATANDIFKDVKLIGQKTHFYVVRLTTNAIRTAPFITGFEVMYAEDYKKEDLVK